jgi:hypothetical protein
MAPCPRPLFSQEQTLLRPIVTSEKCQFRKSTFSFDHLVGADE